MSSQAGLTSHPGSLVTVLEGQRAIPSSVRSHPQGIIRKASSMASLRAWLLCLLLLTLVFLGASSRAHQHSMETRTPDINPAWYTGRGIRPVGRFGRRRAALRDVPGLQYRLSCLPLDGGAKFSQHGPQASS